MKEKYFVAGNQGSTREHDAQIGRIVGETTNGWLVDFGDGKPVFKGNDQGYTAATMREAKALVRHYEFVEKKHEHSDS